MRDIIAILLLFYSLAILQTSFLVHFSIFQALPNLIIGAIVFISLFEPQHSSLGIISAFSGGFFLDVFSQNFLGFWVVISLVIVLAVKFFLKEYVRFPLIQRV